MATARSTLAWLSASAVLLGLIIAWEVTGSDILQPDVPNVLTVPREPQALASKMAVAEINHESLVEKVLARPLFSMTRRPAEALAVSVVEARFSPPRLTGLILTPTIRQAIFATSDERGRGAVMGEGSRFGAFLVLEINSGNVKLLGPDGAEHGLSLSADPAARAAGASIVAAAQIAVADAASARTRVLDVLRTIPGEAARLGPPGGPAPRQGAR